MSDYRVALDVYHGPLDLLLFLIRRDEIEIQDIRIARITQQYIEYVSLLEKLDPEAASEFLVLAATLIEIKSRALLPHPPAEEEDDTFVDPRSELVRQLLEYKKFKDAAHSLRESGEEQKRRHAREPSEREAETDEHELDNLVQKTLMKMLRVLDFDLLLRMLVIYRLRISKSKESVNLERQPYQLQKLLMKVTREWY